MSLSEKSILFFDGECGLCTRSVRALMKRDRSESLYFATLQGQTAARLLERELREDVSTVVYLPKNADQAYLRSDAVLHALIDIHSRWRFIAKALLALPRKARDAVYDVVARNRFKLQPEDACKPLSNHVRTRLLR